jgi:hypothetical protein
MQTYQNSIQEQYCGHGDKDLTSENGVYLQQNCPWNAR